MEVYRGEAMELRRGVRVRFTRNDPASGLTNGETATVETVERNGVLFRLDDGKLAKLGNGDAQLRHIDRAFAATVHAFQGRTVDRILAAMSAENPRLTNQPAFYLAISRARDAAQLVTDDAHKLADRLERATGERLPALDATAKQVAWETVFGRDADRERAGDQVRVFQGGRCLLVAEQAADGADRLPAQERHAGIAMAQILQIRGRCGIRGMQGQTWTNILS